MTALAPWLVAAGAGVLVAGYVWGLSALRARARAAAPQDPPRPSDAFEGAEIDRYMRHIMLREIGGPGQKRLKAARVLVIGAGGLGSPLLLYLAAAGVGTIGVIDHDEVDLTNLQRQIAHTDARIGMPKVFSAEEAMKARNPHLTVRPYHRKLTEEIAEDLFADYDLIIDGTDSLAARRLANAVCVKLGKPYLTAAITQWEGQISLYHPASGGPCYGCVFPTDPAPGLVPTCAEAGVAGPLPGVLGSMLAIEAVKWIVGAGEPLRGRMLIYDALFGESRGIGLKPAPDCAVCQGAGAKAGVKEAGK